MLRVGIYRDYQGAKNLVEISNEQDFKNDEYKIQKSSHEEYSDKEDKLKLAIDDKNI